MQKNTLALLVRCLLMVLGLSLLSLGILFSVKAELGASAWTVFHLGIAKHIGWTQGRVSQVVGLGIIVISYGMGIKPSLATLTNMLLVGGVYDLFNATNLVPTPSTLLLRCLFLVVAVLLTASGTALYISVKLGAGPRDGLMLALTQRSGWGIGVVRNSIELSVLVVGIILGGPFGFGTVFSALAIGPTLESCLQLLRSATRRWHLQAYLAVAEPRRRQKPVEGVAAGSN
ncbi:MAG: YczE/YyaS/YitT family protein [Bacillota bacterium]|jgi:uncharacterized membrane protein YczE